MFRTIYFTVSLAAYLVASPLKMIKYRRIKKTDMEKADEYARKTVGHFGRFVTRKAGIKVRIQGLEKIPGEACLFIGNHQSDFDIPVGLGHFGRTPAFLAKIETKKIPIVRKWMELIYCVFIDRSDIRQSIECLNKSAQLLKEGKSMVIFPEGTRSKGGPIKPFKQGSVKVALKAEVPVVPFVMEGSYRAFEGNKGFRIKKTEINVKFLDPLYIKDMDAEQKKNLGETIFKLICENIDEKYRPAEKTEGAEEKSEK